ncbi:hypothetical protein DENSPDRAFT_885827, partial [Dentipellis sp. KUC8613]
MPRCRLCVPIAVLTCAPARLTATLAPFTRPPPSSHAPSPPSRAHRRPRMSPAVFASPPPPSLVNRRLFTPQRRPHSPAALAALARPPP